MVRLKKTRNKSESLDHRVERYLRHPYLPANWLHQKLKLSHRRHTARLLPRHHTSYGLLLLGLILFGWVILVFNHTALAGPPQTQSGSVTVSGLVPGAPPSQPATIIIPFNGQKLTISPTRVEGFCPADTIVEIYRNSIFAGSTVCQNEGYNLEIDLVEGENSLVAKVKDTIDQYGPDSDVVKVTYQPAKSANPVTPTQPDTPHLLLSTATIYKGLTANQRLNYVLVISGGIAPYALVIDWGDGQSDIVSQPTSGEVKLSHVYEQRGDYLIAATASDSAGNKAYLQTVALVMGLVPDSLPISSTSTSSYVHDSLYLVWPLYILAIMMISMFWLGERHELYKLKKQLN